MKTRCFDHIDLRFVQEKPGRYYHTFYSAGGGKPSEFLCFSPDKNHKPNRTRIAFWADTREEVDQLARLVRKIGGKNLEGPEVCRAYSRGYYACFFEDPDGNKLEICRRESPIIAE